MYFWWILSSLLSVRKYLEYPMLLPGCMYLGLLLCILGYDIISELNWGKYYFYIDCFNKYNLAHYK